MMTGKLACPTSAPVLTRRSIFRVPFVPESILNRKKYDNLGAYKNHPEQIFA